MSPAVFALMLVVFSLTTGEFVIAGILPEVGADLGVSIPSAGLLVSVYAAGMIVGGPTVTVLTSRLRRTPLIAGLIAVSIAANLGSAAAPGYAALLLARFGAGLVVATFFATAIATAAAMAPPDKQPSAVAKVAVGMNLGIVLGAPIGTLIGQNLGWRATFVAIAAVSVTALLLVLRFVPDAAASSDGSILGEFRVLADRDVQLAIALTAVGNVGVVTVFSYLSPLLTGVSGYPVSAVSWLLLVYGAGATAGNFIGGRLADRSLMPSLCGLLAALAGALALFWLMGELRIAAAVMTFLVGALAFAIIPGMQTRVMTSATAAPTLAVAVNASGFQLAAAFAGWLGGQVIDSPLGARGLPLVGAGLTIVGLGIAYHCIRRDRRRQLGGRQPAWHGRPGS